MAHSPALAESMDGTRIRVRTPGKYLVLFAVVTAAIAAGAVGLWLNMREDGADLAAVEYRQTEEGGRAAYYNLPEFLVDLSPDRSGRTAYLKLSASIALAGAGIDEQAEKIDAAQPAIAERLSFFLRELRPEDFEGSEGMARVKREMLRRVNLVIAPMSADDVVIEDLVIQ